MSSLDRVLNYETISKNMFDLNFFISNLYVRNGITPYSFLETYQTSKVDSFAKIVNGF